MARYIDADILYGKIYPLDLVDKRLYTINAKAVEDAIAKTPTADVAPKSEVIDEFVDRIKERLFTIPTVYNAHFGRMIDAIAKEMKGERHDNYKIPSA